MTTKQALDTFVSYDVSSKLLDRQLLDSEVDGTDTYVTGTHHDTLELASAYIYKILATSPDFRQGSLAITKGTIIKINEIEIHLRLVAQ